MRNPARKLSLKTALGLLFLVAFTLPAILLCALFWSQLNGLNRRNDAFVTRSYAQLFQKNLQASLEEYGRLFEKCRAGGEAQALEASPMVFCGLKLPSGELRVLFRKAIASPAFTQASLVSTDWWERLDSGPARGLSLAAETGVKAAYYKKFVLIHEQLPSGPTLFALIDSLPLMSSLVGSTEQLSEVTGAIPVLLDARERILFAPQAVFYRAFFSDLDFARMLEQNTQFERLGQDASFEIAGLGFTLRFIRDLSAPDPRAERFATVLLYTFGLILLLGAVGTLIVFRLVSDPVTRLSGHLIALGQSLSEPAGADAAGAAACVPRVPTRIAEIRSLQDGIHFLLESLRDRDRRLTTLNDEMREQELLVRMGRVSRQIAHDIRSPLAALKVALTFIGRLDEEERLMIRSAVTRIEDIANHLNSRSSGQARPAARGGEAERVCLLSSLIDPVITEKRLQYRSQLNVEILFHATESSYGLFARVNPIELKRVISNLVDNAVEASEGSGRVEVLLSADGGSSRIEVRDHGKGMPREVLSQLGFRGFSYNKPGGTGLGLFHAAENARNWGGRLKIESEPNRGTAVALVLPAAEPPPWFAPEIPLEPRMSVVILDDDVSIHQIWRSRLAGLGLELDVQHFSEPDQVREFVAGRGAAARPRALYLFDYELLGQRESGLDLARALGLVSSTILVTSRHEEDYVLREVEALQVRMLPKTLAQQIPLRERSPESDRPAAGLARTSNPFQEALTW